MRAKCLGDIPTRALKRRSSWRVLTPRSGRGGADIGRARTAVARPRPPARRRCPAPGARSARSTSDSVETPARALEAEIAGSDHMVREFLHRHAEQLADAARPEADSENAGGAGGAQEERAGKLSGEEAPRLRSPLRRSCQRLERLPQIENQLRASVGHHALHGSRRGAFEHPVAIDEAARILTRGELPIVHIC